MRRGDAAGYIRGIMARTSRTRKRSKPDWAPLFLKAISGNGNVKLSCQKAGVGRRTVYDRRDSDTAFAQQLADALQDACDVLNAEARRRGVEGVPRKKFTGKGEPVMDPETGQQYVEREYSDRLLEMLLKAKRPEKYRENITISGDAEKPLAIKIVKGVSLDEV